GGGCEPPRLRPGPVQRRREKQLLDNRTQPSRWKRCLSHLAASAVHDGVSGRGNGRASRLATAPRLNPDERRALSVRPPPFPLPAWYENPQTGEVESLASVGSTPPRATE